MLNNEEQTSDLLQKKPQRQTGWRMKPFLIVLGIIIILGGGLVGAWQIYTTNSPSSSSNPPVQSKGSTGKGSTNTDQAPWDTYPVVYWQTLRTQFAQGLHMSEPQIKSSFQSTFLATNTPTANKPIELNLTDASKWLSELAQAQGISQDQLHTLETTAIQQAHAVLVQQHVLTQQKADETMQGMSQDDVNSHIADAFAMCSQGKKSCDD